MSRTRKIERARKAHLPAKAWRVAYGQALKSPGSQGERLTGDDYKRAQAAAEKALSDQGLQLDPRIKAPMNEDMRTGGVRYGNQRKMRARMDIAARRADRKRDTDPALDVDGELGLPDRPESPQRRRGMRWTR